MKEKKREKLPIGPKLPLGNQVISTELKDLIGGKIVFQEYTLFPSLTQKGFGPLCVDFFEHTPKAIQKKIITR